MSHTESRHPLPAAVGSTEGRRWVGLGGNLDDAGAEATRTNGAQELHLDADHRLAALQTDVLAAVLAASAGTPGTAATIGRAATADAEKLRASISDLAAVDFRSPALSRQVVLFDQRATAAAAAALAVVAELGEGQARVLSRLPAFQSSFAAAWGATDQLASLLAAHAAATAAEGHAARATSRFRILLAAGLACLLLLAATLLLSRSLQGVLRCIGEAAAAGAAGSLRSQGGTARTPFARTHARARART